MALEKYTPRMNQDIVVNRYYLYRYPHISLHIRGLLWSDRHLRAGIASCSAFPT